VGKSAADRLLNGPHHINELAALSAPACCVCIPSGLERRVNPRLLGGQEHAEAGATLRPILGPDAPPMTLHDVPDDRKPQAGAAMRAAPATIGAVEAVEHPLNRI